MSNKDKILEFIKTRGPASVRELSDALGLSRQQIHHLLLKIIDEKKIIKLGKSPKTTYRSTENTSNYSQPIQLEKDKLIFLDNNFLLIDELGNYKEGIEGFSEWCTKRKLPVEKTLEEYIDTKKRYENYYTPEGWIDGMNKLINTKRLEKICLDNVFYLDFYAIERFGKTKLGTILHYAKQGQNKSLIKKLTQSIQSKIETFISVHKIDAVGFVPPTIKREVQLMKYLENGLALSLPKIKINKINSFIPIPQKSLTKLDERIANANNTFNVIKSFEAKRVLLIDDAVGSGATMNQIACKIKAKGVANYVCGLAIVGSFKGFDIITDI